MADRDSDNFPGGAVLANNLVLVALIQHLRNKRIIKDRDVHEVGHLAMDMLENYSVGFPQLSEEVEEARVMIKAIIS